MRSGLRTSMASPLLRYLVQYALSSLAPSVVHEINLIAVLPNIDPLLEWSRMPTERLPRCLARGM